MSADGVAEQRAILARLSTLVGGRIHDGIPDDEEVEKDAFGAIKPYIVVIFGSDVPTGADRSLMDEDVQPLIQPLTVECWGGNADICRTTAGAVKGLIRGNWKPDPLNASSIRTSGGGDFRQKDSAGKPTRFMRAVNGEYTYNLSTPD